MVKTVRFTLSAKGICDVKNITREVSNAVAASGMTDGIVTVFIPGATAGVTTIEFEPGAVHDFQDFMERSIPSDGDYRHNERWGDGNGFSHVRAALLGPSMVLPVTQGRLETGTWQQVVLCDFDNRPRTRRIHLQVMGS